jgi:hypothetical protein
MKIGNFVALRKAPVKTGHWIFKCCICGKEKSIYSYDVLTHKVKSCGCSQYENASKTMTKKTEQKIIGKMFGLLKVVKFAYIINHRTFWKCRCKCGNLITVNQNNLTQGAQRSCGCHRTFKHPPSYAGLRKLYLSYKKSARRTKRKFNIPIEKFKELTSKKCTYCGNPPSRISKTTRSKKSEVIKHTTYKFNGLDRIDSSKGYTQENVVPCCQWCNKIKRERNVSEFKNHIKRIFQWTTLKEKSLKN